MNASPADTPYVTVDMQDTTQQQRYKLFMGCVVPRPIAFVTTLSPGGAVNVAPFSNFMVVSSAERVVVFSVGKDSEHDRLHKDTLANIQDNGEFVVNTVPFSLVNQVQAASKYYPREVSEVEQAGLTLLPSHSIRVPRVGQSKVHFECRLRKVERFGTSHLVFGDVQRVHVLRGLFDDFRIDQRAYSPLGRLGGPTYCSIGQIVEF